MKTAINAAHLLALVLPFIPIHNAFSQGNLTPPGAPAPTMKTLTQIEPRTPIDDTHTPGDANYHYSSSDPWANLSF